jgi:hypothetical protein
MLKVLTCLHVLKKLFPVILITYYPIKEPKGLTLRMSEPVSGHKPEIIQFI